VIRVDHTDVIGSCSSCHNGTNATGTPPDHFVTTQQCNICHSTNGWLPVSTYVHTGGNYPGNHRVRLSCRDCHTSNSEIIPWPSPAYAPDCAGCHARDYRSGVSRHSGLSSDRDCGRCHRVTDRDWD
jgi:hypothetical protein